MKINFKSVEIHNFLSFKDEIFKFDEFEGINLVCGINKDVKGAKNGCGKSSLFLSIVYALFGQLSDKLRIENITNWFSTDRSTRVALYFETNGVEYKVVSGITKKQSFCNLYELQDGEEVDITKSSILETRKYIEDEILHCNLNIFMKTIILNSNPDYNFYNLKHSEKKEFIDKLFDISIFGDIYKSLHKDLLKLDKDIISYQNQLIILNRDEENYRNLISEFDQNKETGLKKLNEEYALKKQEFDNKSKQVQKKNTEIIEKCENKIEELNSEISNLNLQKAEDMISKTRLYSETDSLNSLVDRYQKIVDRHKDILDKLCDDCKEVFSTHYNLKTYTKEIESAKKKLKSNSSKIDSLDLNIKKYEKSIAEKNGKVKLISDKMYLLNSEYENSQKELNTLELGLNNILNKIENIKNQNNPYCGMLDKVSGEIVTVNSNLTEVSDRYRYLKFAENIVNEENLKKFIIKNLVGILNNRIKYYLHRLGANYDIVFDSEMNYEFIVEGSGVRPEFKSFSGGERMRISIATCFAFRDFLSTRSNISSNILVLDEFIDSNIDSMAINNILDILKDFVKESSQKIFIISHRIEVQNDMFDSVVNVIKENKTSRVKIS